MWTNYDGHSAHTKKHRPESERERERQNIDSFGLQIILLQQIFHWRMNTYSIDCVRVSKPEENNFVYAIHGGPLGKSPNAHLFVVRRAQIEMSKRKKINKQTFIRKQKWIVRCLVHFFLLLIFVVVFLILFYYYGPLIAHCTLRECSSIYLCVCRVCLLVVSAGNTRKGTTRVSFLFSIGISTLALLYVWISCLWPFIIADPYMIQKNMMAH